MIPILMFYFESVVITTTVYSIFDSLVFSIIYYVKQELVDMRTPERWGSTLVFRLHVWSSAFIISNIINEERYVI